MDPKEAGVQEAEGHEAGIKRQTAKEKESEMQGGPENLPRYPQNENQKYFPGEGLTIIFFSNQQCLRAARL